MKVSVMGIGFDDMTLEDFIADGMDCVRTREKCMVVTPNAEIALIAKNDPGFKDILNQSRLCLPDGISIKMAAKILKLPIRHKVAGVEFCEGMCRKLSETGGSVYLFGAKPGVAEKAGENLSAKYPGLKIAGTHDGYFAPSQEAEIIADINACSPDMLLCCLGAPKQEKFMSKYQNALIVPVMVGAGGSMDVFAGTVKRAPKLFIKLGLEWFYRLITDPKRIKRMIRIPIYLWDALCFRIKGDNNND
ncbi:MAG: WecB/TagA/CpsF family glycosyltransferase [Clostridia bacterium]|nr:WecB/TagA/CpsF family glycosyltransferase [Clostridia bacterium]